VCGLKIKKYYEQNLITLLIVNNHRNSNSLFISIVFTIPQECIMYPACGPACVHLPGLLYNLSDNVSLGWRLLYKYQNDVKPEWKASQIFVKLKCFIFMENTTNSIIHPFIQFR